MENKQIIVSTDYKKIKNIKFKYPKLMCSNAEQLIREEYNDILYTKEKLLMARELVRNLEKELNSKETEFRNKQEWLNIEFETKTKEYTTRSCNIVHNGDLVYHYNP